MSYMDGVYELENVSAVGPQNNLFLTIDSSMIETWTGNDLSAGALLSKHLPLHIVDSDAQIGALMRGMQIEVSEGCHSGSLYAESLSLAVISYLWGKYSQHHSTRVLNGLSHVKLVALKEYFRENLDQDICLAQMASIVGLSPKHLCRCFKHVVGQSPYQYLLKLRMEEAKRLLRKSDQSITQIGLATGFSAVRHFSTTFRKVTGQSPSQFRQCL